MDSCNKVLECLVLSGSKLKGDVPALTEMLKAFLLIGRHAVAYRNPKALKTTYVLLTYRLSIVDQTLRPEIL